VTHNERIRRKRRAQRLCIDCGSPLVCPGDRCNECRERKNALRHIRWAAVSIRNVSTLEPEYVERFNQLIKPLRLVDTTRNTPTR